MLKNNRSIRKPVKRVGAERYILISLVSFAVSVIGTRVFLQLTGYPQLGNKTVHIAHVLWGGLLLFIAALLPLIFANRWALNGSAVLSGVGVGLFIDEVGKFITQTNDYFFPPAAPIIYTFFLLTLLLYLNVRRPYVPEPREMMYRVLEDLTEVLDRDLDLDERDRLEARLEEVAKNSQDSNTLDMVISLKRFLYNKQLILKRQRPNILQRYSRKTFPAINRLITYPRLKTFIIFSLGVIGVVAMIDFTRLLLLIPDPVHSFDTLLMPLVSHGQLRTAQEAVWFIVRTVLEGVAGFLLIIAGAFITIGRERQGIQIGTIALVIWITLINLLVYYFDQFGAVIITISQFIMLALLTYFRQTYFHHPQT